MASSNTPAMLRLASAATLGPFLRAAVVSTSRMCMGVICLKGSVPILPNTTRCSMFSRRALVISSQSFMASHSRATDSKVMAPS